MRRNSALLLALLWLALPVRAQEETPVEEPAAAPAGPYKTYEPSAKTFRCEIPSEGWYPMEEETAQGFSVHILGPDDPAGVYRAGFDIDLFEPGQPGFVPVKRALDALRREGGATERTATPIRMMRFAAILARVFEVTETRRLPAERLPAAATVLHHFVAVVPSGESYFILRLSSTRDDYLGYRKEFHRFLSKFRPLGYK